MFGFVGQTAVWVANNLCSSRKGSYSSRFVWRRIVRPLIKLSVSVLCIGCQNIICGRQSFSGLQSPGCSFSVKVYILLYYRYYFGILLKVVDKLEGPTFEQSWRKETQIYHWFMKSTTTIYDRDSNVLSEIFFVVFIPIRSYVLGVK